MTPPNSSNPRLKFVFRTGLWSIFARASGLATAFLSIPMVLGKLGTEQFGLWVTITSFAAFSGFLDLGIGNGILNLISSARQRNDLDHLRCIIFSAFLTTSIISLLAASAFFLVYPFVPWARFLATSSPAAGAQVGPAIGVFVACVCIGLPVNLINQIQLAMQVGHIAARWQGLGQLAALGGVAIATSMGASLPWFVGATLASPILFAGINLVTAFRNLEVGLTSGFRINWGAIFWRMEKQLLKQSSFFLVLQVSAILAFGIDLILITSIKGPSQSADFAVIARYFSIIPLTFSLFLTPLWPAYRDALVGRDLAWAVSTLRYSTLGTIVLSGISVAILLLAWPTFMHVWLSRKLDISFELILGLGVFAGLQAVGNALSMFLNAITLMRLQLVMAIVFAISCVASKAIALRTLGVEALPWAGISSFVVFDLLPLMILLPKIIGRAGLIGDHQNVPHSRRL